MLFADAVFPSTGKQDSAGGVGGAPAPPSPLDGSIDGSTDGSSYNVSAKLSHSLDVIVTFGCDNLAHAKLAHAELAHAELAH